MSNATGSNDAVSEVTTGMHKAAIFPGQGSQKPGMGKELYDADATFRETFDRIDGHLPDRDLKAIVFESDADSLRNTANAQLALYACGISAFRAWEAKGNSADIFAGHSIGEYAALVAAGILSLEDGAILVKERGDLMATAGETAPGAMAAVLNLDRDKIAEALEKTEGVAIANDNSPGQIVISGEKEAVASASEALLAAGAKRVLPLNVSGAFHSPLMAEAAKSMRSHLDRASFSAGDPLVANVTADLVEDPAEWPSLLERQLSSPVRWTESVERMAKLGAQEFIEFGSGEVLCGLIKRTLTAPQLKRVDDVATLSGS